MSQKKKRSSGLSVSARRNEAALTAALCVVLAGVLGYISTNGTKAYVALTSWSSVLQVPAKSAAKLGIVAVSEKKINDKASQPAQTKTAPPVSKGSFKLIKGEPAHFWNGSSCVGLAQWEKALVASGVKARYWNGSTYAMKPPEEVYCYAKEAEVASGVPRWMILGICWTEGPKFKNGQTSSAGAGGICQIMPGTFNGSKHKANAQRYKARDNIYAATNYIIRIGLHKYPNSREGFAKAFATPPVWNMHWGQAYAAYDAGKKYQAAMNGSYTQYGGQ